MKINNMKTIKMTRNFWILAFAAMLIFMTSCKKDFETPPVTIPQFTLPTGATLKTIQDFKTTPAGTIIGDVYLSGIVNANDISGNIYKMIYLQDTTGGIAIVIDKICLYNTYVPGQRVFIKCKGLDFRFQNGMPTLGVPYSGIQGSIPENDVDKYIFRDNLPGSMPVAILCTAGGLNDNRLGMNVRFDSVTFQDAGLPFNNDVYRSTQNRIISDATGDVTLRVSGYANFRTDTIPSGKGTVYGILTKYNSTWQLMLRDINDVVF